MNFRESLGWLYGFQKFGMKLGLERINFLVKELGNPHNNFKVIHVGGTNGKGSVCKYLGSILNCSGYNVGVYTSPHLQHFSERITVNGNEISKVELALLVKKVKPIVEKMINDDNGPTFFEIVTAMAFQYFSDKKIDYAIVEVGLGGRFDATNVVDPMITVITNVSLDHVNVLGLEIDKIAFEKSGIIKDNVPIYTASIRKGLKIIEKVSKEKNAPLTLIDNNRWERVNSNIEEQDFIVKGFLKDYSVRTSLLGKIQGENIALSIYVLENLQMNGVYIPDDSIFKGIRNTANIGRMEILGYNPTILIDGAHNPVSMNNLSESLQNDFDYENLILVLGILSDKDIDSILSEIIPIAYSIIVTKSVNNRACDPNELKKMIENSGFKNEIFIKNKISDAIEFAKSITKRDDLICITGSLFTVGEARDHLILKK